jgi:putative FmdB family regulatory protein
MVAATVWLALVMQECQPTTAIFSGAMPIYEYRCEEGHTFEHRQGFHDDPVDVCEVCGALASRVFRAPAVHFKGSGFYNTDYGTRKRSRENEAHAKSEKSSSSSDSKSDSKLSSSDSSKSSSDSKPASSDPKAKATKEG